MQINNSFPGRVSGGISGGISSSRLGEKRTTDSKPQNTDFVKHSTAELNFIPSSESIAGFVQNAVSALKNGIFFDRGAIINLLV